MRKHLIDTDLYIDLIRTGGSHLIIQEIYEKETPGIYFSSIVAQELLSGALSFSGKKLVHKIMYPFEQARRIVTPTHKVWKEAGNVLTRIFRKYPEYKGKLPGLGTTLCLRPVPARLEPHCTLGTARIS